MHHSFELVARPVTHPLLALLACAVSLCMAVFVWWLDSSWAYGPGHEALAVRHCAPYVQDSGLLPTCVAQQVGSVYDR